MALLQHKCVGSYMPNDCQSGFSNGGCSCYVFQSMDKRHYAIVKHDYGKWVVAEV